MFPIIISRVHMHDVTVLLENQMLYVSVDFPSEPGPVLLPSGASWQTSEIISSHLAIHCNFQLFFDNYACSTIIKIATAGLVIYVTSYVCLYIQG